MQPKRARPRRKAPLMYTMPEGETPGIIWGAQEAIVEEIASNTIEVSIEFVETSIGIVERLYNDLKDQHDLILSHLYMARNDANELLKNNEYSLLELKYKELNSISEIHKASSKKVKEVDYLLNCLKARKEEYYVASYRL